MSGFLWGTLGVLSGFGLAAIGDMVSEETRDRLDHLPNAILRLVAGGLTRPSACSSTRRYGYLTSPTT